MSKSPPTVDQLLHEWEWLHGLAQHLISDRQLAEDLVQETAVAVLRKPPREGKLSRGWLAAVLRNLAHKTLRTRARASARERGRGAPGEEASAADVCARAEMQRLLAGLVLDLPPHYRDPVALRFFEGLPVREVAARLQVPVETVRTRLKRALAILRGRLDAAHGGRREDWRAALLPLASIGAPAAPVGSAGAGSAALDGAWLGGGILMATKAKTTAAAAAVALVALLAWWTASGPTGGHGENAAASAAVSVEPASARESGAESRHSASETKPRADGAASSPSAEDTAELGPLDRERDAHGSVVGPSGTPVAGARIEAVVFPWRRSSALSIERNGERTSRGSTVTGADGRYRVRLEPGESVQLRVTADGFAPRVFEDVQAGERLDVTLETGARLTVAVIDVDGRVLEDAAVRLFQSPGQFPDGATFPEARGRSDEHGLCAFDGLPPGAALMIEVEHRVHGSPMWREARVPAQGDGTIEIRMPPSSTLTGRVTAARTGAPIAGATVAIGWTLDRPVTTDAEGRYELPGWTGEGVQKIVALAPGFARSERFVRRGTTFDFALRPGDRVRGRVVGPEGEPVGDVRVAAVGSSWDTGDQLTSTGSAVTAPDGTFEISDLNHGMPHTLVLTAAGYGKALFDVDPAAEEGGVRDVGDLSLQAPVSIAGSVVGEDDVPLARLRVEVRGANADRGRLRPSAGAVDHGYGEDESRRTDDLGRFRFPELAPGEYELTVRLPGRRSLKRTVRLAAGGPETRVDFVVTPGQAFAVKVTDVDGDPVDQAMVWLRLASGDRLCEETDANGRSAFEVTSAPVGVEVITIFELTRRRFLDRGEQAIAAGAQEAIVRLEPAEVLRGKVVDSEGRPLNLFTVRVLRGTEVLNNSWTGADGRFAMRVPSGATVDVELEGTRLEEIGSGHVSRDAFVEGRVEGVSAADDDIVITARTVAHDGALTVLVTGPSGGALEGARVYVTGRGMHAVADGITGPDGRVTLRGLPRADLEVIAARAPGAEGQEWTLPERTAVKPDGQTITLAYRRAARVRGVVVDRAGEPVEGARVSGKYGNNEYHANTDAQGRFEVVVAVDTDSVELRAWHAADPGAQSDAVKARPGETGLRLVLPDANPPHPDRVK